MPKFTLPVKITILSTSVGIVLVTLLAAYFRRRKRRRLPYYDIASRETSLTRVAETHSEHTDICRTSRIPNGDVHFVRRSYSPALYHRFESRSKSGSVSSQGGLSTASTATMVSSSNHDISNLSPEQLCDQGLEAIQIAVGHWEEALEKIEQRGDASSLDSVTNQLLSQLRQLLDQAYRMQDVFEQRLFQSASMVALDSTIKAIADERITYTERRRALSLDMSSEDDGSFVSALDIADLTDLEDQQRTYQHLVLYEAALLELTHGSVPCRCLRTEILYCASDTEFIAKLHCIRLAFDKLFEDESVREWFIQSSRQLISDLLTKADRDPEDFRIAYDDMMSFIKNTENWPMIEEELRGRGVKMMTFVDIVIDFIILDGFDDLDSPPSSVTAVLRNRWLSNGFKETALSTAVWSVLKAKKKLLKFRDGFISHFYAISESLSPLMAWGFLGPDESLNELCNYFKDLMLGFMRDIFSFDKVRYTSIEQLADDILQLAREGFIKAAERLSS